MCLSSRKKVSTKWLPHWRNWLILDILAWTNANFYNDLYLAIGGKNFTVFGFMDATEVINVHLCMLVVCLPSLTFHVAPLNSTLFQGHRGIKSWNCWKLYFSFITLTHMNKITHIILVDYSKERLNGFPASTKTVYFQQHLSDLARLWTAIELGLFILVTDTST